MVGMKKCYIMKRMDAYPLANETLLEMVAGVDVENFVITMKFLHTKFGITHSKLSEITGIPYVTLYKMMNTGIGYCNDQRTRQAIKRLKEALI